MSGEIGAAAPGTAAIGTGLVSTNPGEQTRVRRVRVRVVSGASRGLEGLIDRGTLIVGSHPDADLRVKETSVSRFHAELAVVRGGVRVRDLGSTNGTFVGASRVEAAVVPVGAEIRLGRSRLELLAAAEPAPVMAPEGKRFGRLVGQSSTLRRVFGALEAAARGTLPVLLEGESGTGKSEAALGLHNASAQSARPVVVVDAGARDFAAQLRAALPEVAGGTLILDRFGHLGGEDAAFLVSVCDRRERGELDFRLVTLCREDLRRRVESGLLRRDLYFHVAAVRIVMPPLRDLQEDLPLIVDELSARLGATLRETDRGFIRRVLSGQSTVGEDVAVALDGYGFEGNVRELARLVEQSLLLGAEATSAGGIAAPGEAEGPEGTPALAVKETLPFKEAKEELVEAFERRYVQALLERHGGNLSRAASDAGLDRNYLSRLAKKHNLR